MGITYDSLRLEKIIADYTRITEISIVILDSNFNTIASSNNVSRSDYCIHIQSTPEGKNKCFCSDKILLESCAESKKPEIHICHAGLTDIAIPLIENCEIIGYILLGRIRQTENIHLNDNLLDIYDKEILTSSFKKLVYYNYAEIQSAINLAVAITSYILSENIIKKEFDPIIDKAITYIEDNLHKTLSVDILCKKLNISKNILYEHFKYTLETTICDYITERRILKASRLLSGTEKPIEIIAEECGIPSYTYFTKLFKKRTGITPYKYRKTHINRLNNPK